MSLRVVSIDVDEPVYTGEPFAVAVVVEATSARTTRGVSLLLRGFTTLAAGADGRGAHQTFGSWNVVLADTERLDPGRRRFAGSLVLPSDAPPDGEGVMEVFYQLDARVKQELPWRFDATATRRLAVARRAQHERPLPRPVTISSVARGNNGLFVELSLDDTAFAPGESITGAFSLGNIGERRVDAATVSLVPRAAEAVGGSDVSVFTSLVGVDEGSGVRFSIPLPRRAALSFASRTLGVEQDVLLRIEGSSATCRIPVVIDAFAPRPGAQPPAVVVGRNRWRFTWEDEGRRAGLALEDRELGLHGTLAGAADARVRPWRNGAQARLAWTDLGIGLSVVPRLLLPGGIPFDDVDPIFGKRFIVRGREAAQVRAALGPDLRAALVAFEDARLDDAGAEVISSTSARDPDELRRFLAALEALAEALVAAEGRLPPPSWATPAIEAAWRAFAAATTGQLHAGRMAVTGALVDGDRMDVETRCDPEGRARATCLTLVIDPPADRTSQIAAAGDADLRRSVRHRDPRARIEIRPDAVRLELGGTTADPASLRETMGEMTRLARRLRGETNRGPYR